MSDNRASFMSHLVELRNRLTVAAGAVFIGFFVAWFLRLPLYDLLSAPIREGLADNGIYKLTAIELPETIFVYLKLSLVAGLVMASPIVFFEIWRFVSPGLYRHEKATVLPIAMFSVVFFLLGVLFCHRVLLPFITDFLTQMTLSHPDITMQVTVRNAFSFALSLMLAFGIAFQLPLLLFFLSLIGLATPARLLSFYRYFLVLSFVVGALFTPPDPVSQFLMAGPLNVLYGLGIALSVLAHRQRSRTGKARLPISTWVAIGAALLCIAGGVGYLSLRLGQRTSLLDHVPASARLVAGVRWADSQGRAALKATWQAWEDSDAEPASFAPSRAALTALAADDETTLREVVLFVAHDNSVGALVATSSAPDDPLAAANAALAGEWTREGDDVLRRSDADTGDTVVSVLAPDVLFVGPAAGLTDLERENRTRLSAVAHRVDDVELARRSGPVWSVLWGDPLAGGDLMGAVVAEWDCPLVSAWASLDGDLGLRATVDAGSPGRAARAARLLDGWREARAERERAEAATAARAADRAAELRRMQRLVAAVDDAVAGVRALAPPPSPAARKSLDASSDALVALRKELARELSGGITTTVVPNADILASGDVYRLEASAADRLVEVEARLTPAGGAALLAALTERATQGLPETVPTLLSNLPAN